MKKISFLLIAVFNSLLVMAQPPEGPAKKGMTFGAKTTSDGAVNINTVASKVNSTKETDVKIKGKVAEVCKEMGCWLKMETGRGKMMIKIKDHTFLFRLTWLEKT